MPNNFSKFAAFVSSIVFLWGQLALQGCATPSEKFIDAAVASGFAIQEVAGMPYRHRLFVNASAKNLKNIDDLHVYFDGDGTPWKSNTRIADDPTARNPLILKMMAKDAAPAVLLGRPCYYGLNLSHSCNNTLWTSNRYSETVVESMRSALDRWIAARNVEHVTLIGFSGGGTLATLLASDIKKLKTVVTIAANLDVKAWSEYHGYLLPKGSLNPIIDARIPAAVKQIHLAGLDDDNVPPWIIESFSDTQKNALYLPQAETDHSCCWADIWPGILKTYLDR